MHLVYVIQKDLYLVVYVLYCIFFFFFFSSRRRHTRFDCDWSSDVCSSDLTMASELTIQTRLPLLQSERLLPPHRSAPLLQQAPELEQELELARLPKSLQLLSGSSSGILSTRCLALFEPFLPRLPGRRR